MFAGLTAFEGESYLSIKAFESKKALVAAHDESELDVGLAASPIDDWELDVGVTATVGSGETPVGMPATIDSWEITGSSNSAAVLALTNMVGTRRSVWCR